ncbi:MAG: hypothetical protein IJD71_01145 [Clostridia bacterium]|nr:hypothetical protein [Clostridia bacterium]MBQ9919804.1 hypothetical protein [Clostridia bacterium]
MNAIEPKVSPVAAGCNCAWSNRYSDYILDPKFEPDYNMKSLHELLNLL